MPYDVCVHRKNRALEMCGLCERERAEYAESLHEGLQRQINALVLQVEKLERMRKMTLDAINESHKGELVDGGALHLPILKLVGKVKWDGRKNYYECEVYSLDGVRWPKNLDIRGDAAIFTLYAGKLPGGNNAG